MSRYVLDTDILTLYAQGHPAIVRRVGAEPAGEVAITVLTVEEQLSGWYTQVRRAKRPESLARAYYELARSVQFLGRLPILFYTEDAIGRYEQLRKQRIRIGRTDLRIAATVLEHQASLVTRNLHDFGTVPGLHVEDWSK